MGKITVHLDDEIRAGLQREKKAIAAREAATRRPRALYQEEPLVARNQPTDGLAGAVGTLIIDDYGFDPWNRKPEDFLNKINDIFLLIVGRNDDHHFRRAHLRQAPVATSRDGIGRNHLPSSASKERQSLDRGAVSYPDAIISD
jgi:hypothetical protein